MHIFGMMRWDCYTVTLLMVVIYYTNKVLMSLFIKKIAMSTKTEINQFLLLSFPKEG